MLTQLIDYMFQPILYVKHSTDGQKIFWRIFKLI